MEMNCGCPRRRTRFVTAVFCLIKHWKLSNHFFTACFFADFKYFLYEKKRVFFHFFLLIRFPIFAYFGLFHHRFFCNRITFHFFLCFWHPKTIVLYTNCNCQMGWFYAQSDTHSNDEIPLQGWGVYYIEREGREKTRVERDLIWRKSFRHFACAFDIFVFAKVELGWPRGRESDTGIR